MSTPPTGGRGSPSDLPEDQQIATSSFAEPADRPSRLPATQPQQGVVELAGSVASDVSTLVQDHVELARSEMQASAKAAGASVGMFGGAAVLGYFSVFMFMVAAAEGITSLGLWRWLSYLIVGATLVLIAAVLGLIGQRGLKGVKGTPRAQASFKATTEYLSGRATAARGSES